MIMEELYSSSSGEEDESEKWKDTGQDSLACSLCTELGLPGIVYSSAEKRLDHTKLHLKVLCDLLQLNYVQLNEDINGRLGGAIPHVLQHLNLRVVDCPHCPTSGIRLSDIRHHIQRHHNGEGVPIDRRRQFEGAINDGLRRFFPDKCKLFQPKPNETNTADAFECLGCERQIRLKNHTVATVHILSHHLDEGAWSCPSCSLQAPFPGFICGAECSLCRRRAIPTRPALRAHVRRWHSDEAVFACNRCPQRRFVEYQSAVGHCRRIHPKDMGAFQNRRKELRATLDALVTLCFPEQDSFLPIKKPRKRVNNSNQGRACLECKAVISRKQTFQTDHILRVHFELGKYLCEECPYYAESKEEVLQHSIAEHRNTEPLILPAITVHRQNLKAERRRLFPVSTPSVPIGPLGTIYCHLCKANIPRFKRTHTHHLITAHWPEDTHRFKCSTCDFGAVYHSSVKWHILGSHNGEGEVRDQRSLHSRVLVSLRRRAFPGISRKGEPMKRTGRKTPFTHQNISRIKIKRKPKRATPSMVLERNKRLFAEHTLTKEGKLICQLCSQTFSPFGGAVALFRHPHRRHLDSDVLSYNCTVCERRLPGSAAARRHTAAFHGSDPNVISQMRRKPPRTLLRALSLRCFPRNGNGVIKKGRPRKTCD